MHVNIMKFVEVNESEDLEKQRSFNEAPKESQNQGQVPNLQASKIENEAGIYIYNLIFIYI